MVFLTFYAANPSDNIKFSEIIVSKWYENEMRDVILVLNLMKNILLLLIHITELIFGDVLEHFILLQWADVKEYISLDLLEIVSDLHMYVCIHRYRNFSEKLLKC